MSPQTVQLLFFGVIIVVIVLLMFRNSRKRQRDQLSLAQGLRPGAEIMTTFGVYGTIESVDEQENRIVVRTGPTSQLTIHRQAVGRVVTPIAEDGAVLDGASPNAAAPHGASLNGAPVVLDDAAADPQYGQRVADEQETTPEAPTGKNAD